MITTLVEAMNMITTLAEAINNIPPHPILSPLLHITCHIHVLCDKGKFPVESLSQLLLLLGHVTVS